jgi:hypothetical protein
MIRLVVRTIVALLANAIGLIVAAAVLDDMHLNGSAFILAVLIFTVVFALMQPFLASQLRRAGSAVLGGVALIATLVSLIVTDVASDGLTITGVGTWIAATVIVWLAAVVAAFVLPFLGLKKYLEENRS